MKNKLFTLLVGLAIVPSMVHAEAQDATIITPAPQTHYLVEGNVLKECSMQNKDGPQSSNAQNNFSCQTAETVTFDLIAPKVESVNLRIEGIQEDGSRETVRNMQLAGASDGRHLKIPVFQNGKFTPAGEDYFIGKEGLMGRDFTYYEMNATYESNAAPNDRGNLLLISNKQHPVFYADYGWAVLKTDAANNALCNGASVTYDVTALPDREVLMVLLDEATGQVIKDEVIKTDSGGKASYTIGEFAIGKYRLKGYFGRAGQKMGMADLEKDLSNPESLSGLNQGVLLDTTGCGPAPQLPAENRNNNQNIPLVNGNENNNAPMCSHSNGEAIEGTCTPPYLGSYNLICGGRGGFGGIRNQGGEFADSFSAYLEQGASCSTEPLGWENKLVGQGNKLQVIALPTSSIENDLARKKTAVRAKAIQYWCQKNSSQSISELVGKLTWTFTGCSDGFEAGKSFRSVGSFAGPGLTLRFDQIKAEKVCGKKIPNQFGVNYPIIAYVLDTLNILADAERLYAEDYESDHSKICADFNDTSVKEEDLFGAPGVLELANTYAAQSSHQCNVNCDTQPVNLTFMTPQSPLIYLTSKTADHYTITLENKQGSIHFTSPEASSDYPDGSVRWRTRADSFGTLAVQKENGAEKFVKHLFYEFRIEKEHPFSRPQQGYIIPYPELENFLRNGLLEKMGLNQEQQEDYIHDMLPRLGKQNFYFIGLADPGEWENTIGLKTEPPVEKVQRIMLYFEARSGFTMVPAPDLATLRIDRGPYNSSLLEIGGYVAPVGK